MTLPLSEHRTLRRRGGTVPWPRSLLAALLCAGIATVVRLAVHPILGAVAPFATYFAAVVGAAFFIGTRAGVATMLLGVPLGLYFFFEPRLSFAVAAPGDLIAVLLYLLGSTGIVLVAARLRRALTEARRSATLLALLHEVRDRTVGVDTLQALLERLVETLQRALGVDTAVILQPGADGRPEVRAAVGLPPVQDGEVGTLAADVVARRETVLWVGSPDDSGLGPALRAAGTRALLGVPLIANGDIVGVLHVGHARAEAFTEQDARLLEVVAAPLALAIVRQAAADALRGAEEDARRERESLLALAERARADAVLANRAKDDFLATLSHELRSPLQGVLGWLTLLKRGQLDAAQTVRALDAVERSVRLQAQLVGDLMDVTRIAAGKLELDRLPFDLCELVGKTVEEFMPTAAAKPVSLVIGEVHPGAVLGDRERLHQVLSNLLTNALKFTPAGGRVTVACTRAGNALEVSVSDTGEGIAPEMLPRLFERFTQADTVRGRRQIGLGLGLAIVRHLVELHGGTVEAESPGKGRGATFRVFLPVALGDWPVAAPPSAPGGAPRLDGLDIVLVEDDADTREAMRCTLSAAGAQVRAAASVAQAWQTVAARPPAVVLTDLMMPEEDGFALLHRVRHAPFTAATPVIALTGSARPEDRLRVLTAGFAAYLSKPISADELVRIVHHVACQPRRADGGVGASPAVH